MELCVIFERDAKGVIKAVLSNEMDELENGQMVEDLKRMLLSCLQWSLVFIHREGNVVAHSLAKTALHNEGDFCWTEEGPQEIYQLIVNEKVRNDLRL